MKIKDRKIVIINQAVNYLTIGICNEFAKKFEQVDLVTGSVHVQGEELNPKINIKYISKWKEAHGFKKMITYVKASLQIYWLLITRFRRYEVFFISLPPMGYLLNIFLRHKFSMLIWDVYPDVFKITGMKKTHPVYKTWAYLNKVSFKKAYKLYTIGNKMSDLIGQYVSKEKIIITPIWSIFQDNDKVDKMNNPFIKQHNLGHKFIVQYSGNIGLTHNVEILVDIAKKMVEYPNIVFQIIGRGPRRVELEKRVKEEKIPNCYFLPFQTDDMFPYSLSATDLGVVVIDELTSKGSVPSKSYNLMSYGIPSLYIAAKDSELHDYAEKFNHAKCFEKIEIDAILDYILKLSNNKLMYKSYAINALNASKNFKRNNAQKIISEYLK